MARSYSGWYWNLCSASWLVLGGAIASSEDCTLAQPVPDGTLGTESSVVTPTNNNGLLGEQIDGGAIRGTNLFHSFEQFSVPTGSAAYFNNALDIQNIISRVTGSSISKIDGSIQANGTANLFLLNPNGIIFGPNASLNIRGSFVGSTASGLNFADGTQFSATAPQTTPLLTVSLPIGLQFGGNPGRILVQRNGQGIRTTSALIDTTVGLRVQPNQTLALVGGDIELAGGTLKTAGGRIELGSVAGLSLVSLTPADKGWALGYQGVQNFRDIQLFQQAAVDASGLGGGDIQVQGRQVSLLNGSQIEASTLGAEPGGTLIVRASESVKAIGGSAADSRIRSGLFTTVYPGASGAGGNLTIETGRLLLQDGGVAATDTYGLEKAGTLTVSARDSVEVIGKAVDGRNSSSLRTSVQPKATGTGGNLIIKTRRLLLQDGGFVFSGTTGVGPAGNLSVTASESVELTGERTSSLSTLVYLGATGIGGNLSIETGRLIVRDGSTIQAATFGAGSSGTLEVKARDLVELSGTSMDGRPSQLTAQTALGTGNAGNLTIETEQLTVWDKAEVNVSSKGSGIAGELQVQARAIQMENQGAIIATTSSGNGGDITLQAQDLLLLRRNSNISTKAGTPETSGTGGSITIDTNNLVALENSDIDANAFGGPGGQVTINTQGIFGTAAREQPNDATSDITASSNLGPQFSGTVEINTPDVDLSRGLVTLPAELVNVSGLIAQSCPGGGGTVGRGASEFIITGRGGLPPSPSEALRSDAVRVDLRASTVPATNQSGGAIAPQSPRPTAVPLVEAQGWVTNDKGEVILTSTAPTVTPHSPWLPTADCHASKNSS